MKLSRVTAVMAMSAIILAGNQAARGELLALYEGDIVNGPNTTVALDSSGNGNHGVFRGAGQIELNSGITGGALGFPDVGGTTMRVNPAGDGAFDSISLEQALTVGFWMAGEESAAAPRNQSAFWAVGVEGETDRAFQAHVPWSNGTVFFDVGGCCNQDNQRLQGPIDREFWDAATGDEWTHYAFTIEPDFGDAAIYINGEEVLLREPTAGTSFIPDLASLWIGSAPNAGNRFSGRLDDFFITDNALSEDDVNAVISDGARSFFEIDEDPEEYSPVVEVGGRVEDVDGQLGGAAFIASGDGDIESWSISETFRVAVGDTEVVATADLGPAGASGEGAVGDATTSELFGDVPLGSAVDREFTVNINVTGTGDPVLGDAFATSITGVIPGQGGGEIDPFVLLGDLNQDGSIAFADFLILSANFGAVQGEGAAENLPEPSSALLLLFGILPFLRRRRA